MICENCMKEHAGSYGSGRFCSQSCARSFASKINRDKRNEKISNTLKLKNSYVVYKNKVITKHKYSTITKKHNEYINKRSSIAKEIHLSDSPYSEYDTAYTNSGTNHDCYYLTKHDDNNKIIKRAIVPYYRYTIECELNRKLNYNEVIHHIDENHINNERENLIVLSRKLHNQLHKGVITIENIINNNMFISQ